MFNHKLAIFLIILAGGSLSAYALATSTFISDSGIITPALTVGDVTITGTCTGCGGGEGDFSSYSLVLNSTISGTTGDDGRSVKVSSDGSVMGIDIARIAIIKLDGTVVTVQAFSLNVNTNFDAQSSNGKYQVFMNNTKTGIQIYKESQLIQTLGSFTSFVGGINFAGASINISGDGKYIAIYGKDLSGTINRVQIWEGS